MNKKEFTASLKNKSVKELLVQLENAQSGKVKTDPDLLTLLLDELEARQLSAAEQNEYDRIMGMTEAGNDDARTSSPEANDAKAVNAERKAESLDPPRATSERYMALKALAGVLSVCGYAVLVIGLIALVYMASENNLLQGLLVLLGAVLVALPSLAFSNLIQVFIDIESNTRKTMEAMQRTNARR
jgi:hypothetical protein